MSHPEEHGSSMSSRKKSWSLQFSIQLMILLAGLSVILAHYIVSYQLESEHVRQESTKRLNAISIRLTKMSTHLEDPIGLAVLHEEMASMSKMANLTHIVFADEHNQVLASTDPQWRGQSLDSTELPGVLSLPADRAELTNTRINEIEKNKLMTGTLAFELPAHNSNHGTDRLGVISVGMDLQRPLQTRRNQIQKIALISGLLVLLVAGLFWMAMRRLLTNPLNRLVSTTRRFADGDYSVAADISQRNELGEISNALDTLRTTAHQREQAQASRNRLAQIVEDSVHEIYISHAETFQILNANRAARESLGYTVEESQQLMPWDFVDGLTQESIEELVAPLLAGVLDAQQLETFHKRKDGTTYPVSAHIQFMATQTPPVFAAMVQDITEQKHQEANIKLRDRAIEEVDVGITITDAKKPNYPIVYVNQTLCSMTGCTKEELLGTEPRKLHGDNLDQSALHHIQAAYEKAEPVQVLIKSTRKDGSQFMDDLSVSPVRDDLGVLTHFIEVHRDVTAKLDTEAKLHRSQKIEAIGQLSGGVAHDFNNLLSVITGNLEFLATDITNEEHRELLSEAEAAAQMGARLTRRLLTFSKQGQLVPTVLSTNEHVLSALELLRTIIGENISLSSNLSSDIWSIRADPSEIENTVVNLAINARDAMPKGGKLSISTKNMRFSEEDIGEGFVIKPGDYVQLSVSDTGNGMTDEVKARIFEPFFTTKEPGKGTGLGLASIYGFAQQSGGTVHVYSEIDHGTVINVYLPRHTENVTVKSESRPVKIELTDEQGRILVVEDNDLVQKVTVKRLRALGYDTYQASNGPEAVSILEQQSDIDLILTDIVMDGGMSGYDVARWAQQHSPQCKLLLTSGFNEQMAEKVDLNVEELKILQKPYNSADLQQAVEAALNRSLVEV